MPCATSTAFAVFPNFPGIHLQSSGEEGFNPRHFFGSLFKIWDKKVMTNDCKLSKHRHGHYFLFIVTFWIIDEFDKFQSHSHTMWYSNVWICTYFFCGTVFWRFHNLREWSSEAVTRADSVGWKYIDLMLSKWLGKTKQQQS